MVPKFFLSGIIVSTLLSPGRSAEPSSGRARELLEIAEAHLSVEDYPAAKEKIREALRNGPPSQKVRDEARKLWRAASKQDPRPRDLLKAAEMYLDAGEDEKAREKILETLRAAPDSRRMMVKAESLWKKTASAKAKRIERRRREGALSEAERLAARGESEKAAKVVLKVLEKAEETDVAERALAILKNNVPSRNGLVALRREHFFSLAGWCADFLIGGALLALVYLVGLGLRWTAGWLNWRRWRVDVVKDDSGKDASKLVLDYLGRWEDEQAQVAAGLMRLGMMAPPLRVPTLELSRTSVDFSPALESLSIKIGAVSLGGVAQVLKSFSRWWNSGRSRILIGATLAEKSVRVSLTSISRGGKIRTVSALEEEEGGVEAAAKSASYKMYYLLTSESAGSDPPLGDADTADRIRLGLDKLRKNLKMHDHGQLESALKDFRDARIADPTAIWAYLYEGVALDRLHRQKEAITIFQLIDSLAQNSQLKLLARYMTGVARIRSYNAKQNEEAISVLSSLESDVAEKEPHATFEEKILRFQAQAARANAVAHRALFWQSHLEHKDVATEEEEILARKKKGKEKVGSLLKDVIKKVKEDTASLGGVPSRVEILSA